METDIVEANINFNNCDLYHHVQEFIKTFEFRNNSQQNQVKILDNFAKILIENLDNNIDISIEYYREYRKFIKLFCNYDTRLTKPLNNYKELRLRVNNSKIAKLLRKARKIFSITNSPRRKILKIAGCTIKFKYLKGKYKREDELIKKIKHMSKLIKKDSYILFDCLTDPTVECIDAYSLFRYMQKVGKNAYYVIMKENKLYTELCQNNNLNNIIAIDYSVKKSPDKFLADIYYIIIKAKAVITSFAGNTYATERFFREYKNCPYIFIQHGQIFMPTRSIESGYIWPTRFNYILTSSENESNILNQYGWKKSSLIKVGLPRWDLLNQQSNKKNKSILIMFTWRRLTYKNFERSLYKKHLLTLLNNKIFSDIVHKNITTYFAPHHSLLSLQGIELNVESNKNIKFINTEQISKYIKECDMLITDFSSVCFDFMFQNKPVIHYILDKNDNMLNELEQKGINNFDTNNMLSNVYDNESRVIQKLEYYINNNFKLEPEIINKYNKFFYTKEDIRKKLLCEIDKICI